MQFKDVIGQDSIKQRLIQAVAEDRIPHAQLLVGPPGNGKLALALAFAQYINCPDKHDNDSCGLCSSCRKYAKLIHPDLHFTIPVIKTGAIDKPTSSDYMTKWRQYFGENPYPQYEKWMQMIADENKQGSIYVDEAKDLIHKLNQKSYEAEYKVSIIWLPETMNITCANKILKILEEPPTKFSLKFAPFINEKNVMFLFREFEKAYTDISMNGNAKLIFTDLGLKVSKLIRL